MKFFYILVLITSFFIVGCDDKGPAEKAGEKIDETAEKVADKVEEACEKVKDTVDAKDKDC